MAEGPLRDHPELRPFVLSNVQFTGTRIGAGSYGSVEEVTLSGVVCAAKKIHDIFHDPFEFSADDHASAQFVRECRLMSTLRHPHIVQFLGVCFIPGSRLPALVMERLLTSLHDLLEADQPLLPAIDAPKPFFPLSLKCSILHNVATGLAYLHGLSPPIIHRDLSARNVLLNSGMVAKIADLGVARIVPRMLAAATMTKAPGAGIYMPPEALEAKSDEEEQRSNYDASIDVFSFGVVSMFTLCQTFPCNLLAPTYREGRRHIARTELERRNQYMQMIYRQLRKNHPLLQMIERCLDFPENRPSIREVLHLLEQARAEDNDQQIEMSKLELLRALQTLTTNQDSALHVELQSCMREVAQLQQRLQSCMQQLARKESELCREQEDVKKAHQQIHQLREQESNKDELIRTMGVKLAEAEQQLIQLSQQVTEKDELLESNQMELFQAQEELNSMEQATWSQVGDEHASETTLPTFLPEIPKQECASSSQMLHAVRPTPKPRTFVNRSRSEPVQQSTQLPEVSEQLQSMQHSRETKKRKAICLEIHMNDLHFGDVLGEGAGGTVFAGTWKSKGIPVALKRVRVTPDKCDAKVMAVLGEHPNIISFYGFAHNHPETTIVTALAKNGSLYNYLHTDGNKPTRQQSVKWARHIAYGMAHMHKLELVHRDLKSSNVLFTNDMEAQICDFGTSRPLENTTYASKTRGTWRWMAPEVANEDAISMMCDVFSFCMVVWELIEHEVPFHDSKEFKASMRIVSGERPPFLSIWPDYLANLVEAGWSHHPHDRPSFTDIVTSLENEVYFRR